MAEDQDPGEQREHDLRCERREEAGGTRRTGGPYRPRDDRDVDRRACEKQQQSPGATCPVREPALVPAGSQRRQSLDHHARRKLAAGREPDGRRWLGSGGSRFRRRHPTGALGRAGSCRNCPPVTTSPRCQVPSGAADAPPWSRVLTIGCSAYAIYPDITGI